MAFAWPSHGLRMAFRMAFRNTTANNITCANERCAGALSLSLSLCTVSVALLACDKGYLKGILTAPERRHS